MGTAIPALGSNGATSRLFGTAAGADYWFSAHRLAGFALAGGGTNLSIANDGRGRSDLFQAGAFARHHNGPAYLSAALAYGWQETLPGASFVVQRRSPGAQRRAHHLLRRSEMAQRLLARRDLRGRIL